MVFSKRLVFVYTLIIVIPLFIIIMIISNYISRQWYEELSVATLENVSEQAKVVNDHIYTFNLIQNVVRGNDDMMFMLSKPETLDKYWIANTIIDEVEFMARLLSVVPEVYSVRLFVDNTIIPERWPFLLHSTRTNLQDLDEWEYNYRVNFMGNQDSLKRPSVCQTLRLMYNKKILGYTQISSQMKDFFPFLFENPQKNSKKDYANYAFVLKEDSMLSVTDEVIDDSIFPTLPPDMTEKIFQEIMKNPEFLSGVKRIRENFDSKIVAWHCIPRMDLVLVRINSTDSINKKIILFHIGTLGVLFLSVFLMFFIISKITKRLMERIYTVMDGIKQVKRGRLDVQVPITGNDEITETQEAFNSMVVQLEKQIEQIKRERELVAETEIKAMQNQINAHFLYNVLETIKMQAVLADQDEIVESINVLGKMMRYCLRWRNPWVTIQQEVEYICLYVSILNMRNDYVISLQIEVDPEFSNLEIPKMVLQPIVENAFNYAVEPMGRDAVIKVYTKLDEDGEKLWLCVQDFGCGIEKDKLNTMQEYLADDTYEKDNKGGIGLKNIQQRLNMFYGKDFRIKIESEIKRGTLVCVPVRRSNSNDNNNNC